MSANITKHCDIRQNKVSTEGIPTTRDLGLEVLILESRFEFRSDEFWNKRL